MNFSSWFPEMKFTRWQLLVLAFSFLLVLAARAFFIFRFPLHPDELYTFNEFISQGVWRSMTYYPVPNNHIFYSILGSIFYTVSGDSFWAVRLPAVLISLGFTPVIFLVLRRFVSFEAAFLGTALFCFSRLGLYYSFHGRGYFLVAVCSLIAALAVWDFLQRSRKKDLLLLVFASVIGFYAIPVFLYPFVCFMAFGNIVLLATRQYRKLFQLNLAAVITGLLTLLLYLPVFLHSGLQAVIGNDYVTKMGRSEFNQLFWPRLDYLFSNVIGREPYGWVLTLVFVIALLVYAGRKLFIYGREAFNDLSFRWALLLLCLEIIPVILMLVQVVLPPYRVFIFLAPFQFAGMAWFLFKLLSRLKLQRYSLFLAFIIMVCYGAHQVRALENYRKSFAKIYTYIPGFVNQMLAEKNAFFFMQDGIYHLYAKYEFTRRNREVKIDFPDYNPTKKYEVILFRQVKGVPTSVNRQLYQEFYRDDYVIAFRKR